MHRWTNWLASIGVGAGVVLGTWAMASAQSLPLDPTGVTVPTLAVTVPTLPLVETTLPPVDTTLPPVTTVPGVTVPPVPTTVALPDPEVTVPTVPTSVTVPVIGTVTIPTLPGVTVPPVLSTVPGGVRPDGLVECAHFVTQQAAQLALQLDPRLAALLDADRDGVACELLPSGPATVPAGSNGTVNLASLPAGPPGVPGVAAPLGSAVGDPSGSGGEGSGAGAGPGGSAGAGAAPGTVSVAGDPLAATSPLEVPEADAGHLVLIVLAFVLLVGSSAGLARELSARHAARAGEPEVALA